ncbi:sigma factor-like helix-turn-helix DNA-binding protein [Actinoplanes sp. NPDC049599]|uniref:sigma factor-like helix-turn-helix DNA-binding protein n=1 Tax=Actinoplanes sp. NPDC049599 TaxID=3363903 RepID=UPI0037BC711E
MSDAYVLERYIQLRRAAFLMCGDWALADDLARTTLARVLADPDITEPDLWAYADLMAAFKKPRGRREHVFVAPEQPVPVGAGAASANSSGGGRQQLAIAPTAAAAPPVGASVHTVLVLDALHGLSPRCRAVLVLRHFCGLAIDETADALDIDDSRVLAFEAEGLGAFAGLLVGVR